MLFKEYRGVVVFLFGEEKKVNKDQYTKEFLKNQQTKSKESKISGIESYIFKSISMSNVCMCLCVCVCVYFIYIIVIQEAAFIKASSCNSTKEGIAE